MVDAVSLPAPKSAGEDAAWRAHLAAMVDPENAQGIHPHLLRACNTYFSARGLSADETDLLQAARVAVDEALAKGLSDSEYPDEKISNQINDSREYMGARARESASRSTVSVSDADRHRVVRMILGDLARQARIFQRGGVLVEVQDDGHVVELAKDMMPARVSRSTNVQRMTPKGNVVAIPPPVDLMMQVLAEPDKRPIRELAGVAHAPYLRPDGSMVTEPGYDESTRVLLVPDGPYRVPETPGPNEIQGARALLDEMLCDFPFEHGYDRGAAMAFLLTVVARTAVNGPAPLFLFDASAPGSGKGLLLQVLCSVGTGARQAPTPVPPRDEEMSKLITSKAMDASPVLWLDNKKSESPLAFASLDAAITGGRWESRILGSNRLYRGPLDCVFALTGNNITVASDTARRVVRSRLVPREAHPEKRQGFRHPDLKAWVSRNRSALYVSALLLLQNSIRSGNQPSALLGSFEEWSRVVRTCVEMHWGVDPVSGQDAMRSHTDVETETFEQIVDGLARLGAPMSAGQILSAIQTDRHRHEQLASAVRAASGGRLTAGELPSPEALSHILKRYEDRASVAGMCIVSERRRSRQTCWSVVSVVTRRLVDPRAAEALVEIFGHGFQGLPFTLGAVLSASYDDPQLRTAIFEACPTLPGRSPTQEQLGAVLDAYHGGRWRCFRGSGGDEWIVLPADGR